MKKAINVAAQTITFSFEGFHTRSGEPGHEIINDNPELAPITLAMADVSPANATYAMLHGFGARIGDNAALSRKQKDGSVIKITETMRREEILKMVSHYASGSAEWELGRTAQIDPRAVKLAEAKGITIAEASAILAKIEMDALTAAMAAE